MRLASATYACLSIVWEIVGARGFVDCFPDLQFHILQEQLSTMLCIFIEEGREQKQKEGVRRMRPELAR